MVYFLLITRIICYLYLMKKRSYYVYIMTNSRNYVLYTGVTNDLVRRVYEHKSNPTGFSAKYKTSKLVYFEEFDSVSDAIDREKRIKGGSRDKKIALIKSINPDFIDLYDEVGSWRE